MINMFITDFFSITELARLTKKSRPSIYKYISDYQNGKLDNIPYSFIELFKMSSHCSKKELIVYCNKTYNQVVDVDDEIQSIIAIIMNNKEKLCLDRIKTFILEEIHND